MRACACTRAQPIMPTRVSRQPLLGTRPIELATLPDVTHTLCEAAALLGSRRCVQERATVLMVMASLAQLMEHARQLPSLRSAIRASLRWADRGPS